MSNGSMADYNSRSPHEWLSGVDSGKFVLPNFQRSLVWDNSRTADYLNALIENRPTGLFLTLKAKKQADGKLQFVCRTLKSVEKQDIDNIEELILDGQQRLTTLWRALNWQMLEDREGEEAGHRFYARVESFDGHDLEIDRIESYSSKSRKGQELLAPESAYKAKLVPIDILLDKQVPGEDLRAIPDWCIKTNINRTHGDQASRKLEDRVREFRERLLMHRRLHYCVLAAEIDRNVAVDIFVETNKSSATIKRFDIVVAIAEGDYEEDLRNHIRDFHHGSSIVEHYFSRDEEKMIPQVGEWLLKVACLETGKPPKEQHYESALKSLFRGNTSERKKRLGKLQANLEAALVLAAGHGAPNHRTLPAWPPIHVIAAVQGDLQSIKRASSQSTANELISAYLWRAFFTDRYEVQANDRLFDDYRKIQKCLRQIKDTGDFSKGNLPEIFRDTEHSLPEASDLAETANWIRTGRLGRAIAALSLHKRPIDWVTGAPLDADKVRELEDSRKLDRHHIFPDYFLKSGGVSRQRINNGLNGVLLSKAANQELSKKDPAQYLSYILETSSGLTEGVLRKRVETHLVPYDALKSNRRKKESRYKAFLQSRAALIVSEINRLASLEAGS